MVDLGGLPPCVRHCYAVLLTVVFPVHEFHEILWKGLMGLAGCVLSPAGFLTALRPRFVALHPRLVASHDFFWERPTRPVF